MSNEERRVKERALRANAKLAARTTVRTRATLPALASPVASERAEVAYVTRTVATDVANLARETAMGTMSDLKAAAPVAATPRALDPSVTYRFWHAPTRATDTLPAQERELARRLDAQATDLARDLIRAERLSRPAAEALAFQVERAEHLARQAHAQALADGGDLGHAYVAALSVLDEADKARASADLAHRHDPRRIRLAQTEALLRSVDRSKR